MTQAYGIAQSFKAIPNANLTAAAICSGSPRLHNSKYGRCCHQRHSGGQAGSDSGYQGRSDHSGFLRRCTIVGRVQVLYTFTVHSPVPFLSICFPWLNGQASDSWWVENFQDVVSYLFSRHGLC